MKKRFDIPGAGSLPATVAHGVSTNAARLFFCSGQVALDAEGNVVGVGNVEIQTRQVMENIAVLLEQAGFTFADVTKVTMFLTDIGDLPNVIKVRNEYLRNTFVAATAVEVKGLVHPDLKVEIEVIACSD
ncbi:MAG: RidA family protein [Firmicutes bacterium]|mgnify:CR=1 FL=1|jgi:enamine deaminase RidA (YjgF/YER057c/UK114 family)|nr:RidA family protein [Bacillota bacterium]